MKKNILICAALIVVSMVSGILLFVDSGAVSTTAEPARLFRPSEQFAEIVARGWPSSAITDSPYVQGYESDQVIIPNVDFELTIFDGSFYSGPDYVEAQSYQSFPRDLDQEVEEFFERGTRVIYQ